MYPNQYFAKRFASKSKPHTIHNVTVIGGGVMGSGIAQVAAFNGLDVVLVERTPELLKRALKQINANLSLKTMFSKDKSIGPHVIEGTLNRIQGVTQLNEGMAQADIVIESILENMEVKHKLFKTIDPLAPEKTIFATNSSSLPIAGIAEVTKRKDRFIGIHFFHPVHMRPIVEVAKIPETSNKTYQAIVSFATNIGNTMITCKDTPGFIVTRLLVPYLVEAIHMLERHEATPSDIDTAMKLACDYPIGPIEYIDTIGLDALAMILNGWHKRFPDNPSFKPPATLLEMVRNGKLGRKTGRGFYEYKKST